jgi:hypothetical protein
MKTLAFKPLAIATTVLLGMTLSGSALAGSVSYSNLEILGLKMLDHSTGTQLNQGTTVQATNITNTSTTTGALNSGSDINTDFTQACVGNGAVCALEDIFAQQAFFASHFSRGDADLNGTIIDGLGAGATGASANSLAENQLISSDSGVSSGNVQLNSSFTFTLAAATQIAFSFTSGGGLHSKVDTTGDGNAQASSNFTITITDQSNGGATVFSWSPDGFVGATGTTTEVTDDFAINDTISADNGDDISRDYTGSDFYAFSNATLNTTSTYKININHTSDASAKLEIPEPTSIAMLGLGLFGLAVAKRRKS